MDSTERERLASFVFFSKHKNCHWNMYRQQRLSFAKFKGYQKSDIAHSNENIKSIESELKLNLTYAVEDDKRKKSIYNMCQLQ